MTTAEIIAAYLGGMSASQIAAQSGIAKSAVYSRLYRANVRVGPRGRNYGQPSSGWERRKATGPAAQAVLGALGAKPATADELADLLGYAPTTVVAVLNSLRRMGKVRSWRYVWALVSDTGGAGDEDLARLRPDVV